MSKDRVNENVIEWIDGEKEVSVTLSQKKHVNKIKKLKSGSKSNDITHYRENEDGSIFCHVPLSWIKISPPRTVSQEQVEKFKSLMVK